MGLSGSKKKKGMTPKALQSTSKLFSGFGKSKATEVDKNKKEEGGRTLLLLNIGGKANKNAAATSGLGGKFKGFFGKRKLELHNSRVKDGLWGRYQEQQTG